jgi:hypothetical protein
VHEADERHALWVLGEIDPRRSLEEADAHALEGRTSARAEP